MDQKTFIASSTSGNESWCCGRDPPDCPRKSRWPSPRIGWSRVKVDVLRPWSPPRSLIRPSAIGKINFPFSFGKPLLHWVFSSRFPIRPSSPTPQCLQPVRRPFQIPPAYNAFPRNNPGKTFFPNWWIRDWSFAVIGWYSTNEPNGMISPVNDYPTCFSYDVYPSDNRSWTFRK